MADGPKNELPTLEMGLWIAAGAALVMGALGLLFASRLDAADNRLRQAAGYDRPVWRGRNRKGGDRALGRWLSCRHSGCCRHLDDMNG